ncbi:MAG: hypothetical protein ACXACP_03260 [Candidatus Hodarchaeales archaeon]
MVLRKKRTVGIILTLGLIIASSSLLLLTDHYYNSVTHLHTVPPTGELLRGWPLITDGMHYQNSYPRLYDINNDTSLDLLAVTGHGTVYVANSTGTQLFGWPRNYAAENMAYFFPDTFIADFVASNSGVELGFYQLLDSNTSKFILTDLEGTILSEWLYPNMTAAFQPFFLTDLSSNTSLLCIWNKNNPENQITLHHFTIENNTMKNLVIAPNASLISATAFQNPVTHEISLYLLSSNSIIYRVNSTGSVLNSWTHPLLNASTDWLNSLFAVNFEYGSAEVILWTNSTGQILAFTPHGEVIDSWIQKLTVSDFFSPTFVEDMYLGKNPIAVDIDKDGIRELITSWDTQHRLIISFRANGTIIPEGVYFSNLSLPSYTPLVADFNLDSNYDFLITGRGGDFQFISSNGEVLTSLDKYPFTDIYRTVLLGDLTGDNFCELIFTTSNGEIYAYSSPVVGRSMWTESTHFYLMTDFWDRDHDGLIDRDENYWGTNPLNNDSDDDKITDFDEFSRYNSDPLNKSDPPLTIEWIALIRDLGRLLFAFSLISLLVLLLYNRMKY